MSRRSEAREEFLRSRQHEKDRNVPGLIGDLSSGQKLVRAHAARVLARLRASNAAPHIAELADDTDERVHSAAFHALGVLKAREFEALLIEGLNDPAPIVRMSAADALARLGARDAIPNLRKLLETDPDPEVGLHAVESLVILGDQQSRDRVPEVLSAISRRVRGHPRWKRLRKAVEASEPLSPWESWWESPIT